QARVSSGSSSKAMKLLGLSKLPPDASRAEHLALIEQHRSVRKERAKSTSPAAGSIEEGGNIAMVMGGGGGGGGGRRRKGGGREGGANSKPEHRGGGGQEQCPDEDSGGGAGGGGDMEDGEQGVSLGHHQHLNSEWLDMREASLKLTPADLDDQFLKRITDLMNQFPEPPTRDPTTAITDLNSPSSIIGGWGKGDSSRRGLHMPKTSSQRRATGSVGSILSLSQEIVKPRQNPIFQQQFDNRRGARGLDSPMRIRYSKPEDEFSL
ncbi:unnamed protein product, partial [Pylaiella littoralis]